jgi:hypothetical protein
MPKVDIAQFGLGGLQTDIPHWKLGPEFLTSARNVEISDQAIRTDFGHRLVSAYPASGADTPRKLFFERDLDQLLHVVCGDASVWAHEGVSAQWADISSAAGYTGPKAGSIWSQAQLADQLSVYNCNDWYPEYWSPVGLGQVLQDLPYNTATADDTWRSRNYRTSWMLAHRGSLIALGIDKDGVAYPSMFKCSHPVSPGFLPSWDETNPNLRAREILLDDDAGKILCGDMLRGGIAVYKRYSTWMVEPTSAYTGSIPQVYAGRRVLDGIGALSPHSVVSYQTHHFMAIPGDIGYFDGNSYNSLADGKIRKTLNQLVDPDLAEETYAVLDRFAKRVWFCFASFGAARPDVAVIYDIDSGTWTTRDIGEGVLTSTTGMIYQPKLTVDDLTFPISSWTDPVGGSSWGTMVANVVQMTSSEMYSSHSAGLDTDDSEKEWIVERTNMRLSGTGEKSTAKNVFIQSSWENVEIKVRVGAQEYPDAPISWEGVQILNPSIDRKVSCRSTGNLHCLRISGPASFLHEISGVTFEIETSGSR